MFFHLSSLVSRLMSLIKNSLLDMRHETWDMRREELLNFVVAQFALNHSWFFISCLIHRLKNASNRFIDKSLPSSSSVS